MTSLREQSLSVIVSALTQQGSLEPDQLHVRLPDYVPSRCKTAVAHRLEAQLACSPTSDLFPREPIDPIALEELEMTTPEGVGSEDSDYEEND